MSRKRNRATKPTIDVDPVSRHLRDGLVVPTNSDIGCRPSMSEDARLIMHNAYVRHKELYDKHPGKRDKQTGQFSPRKKKATK